MLFFQCYHSASSSTSSSREVSVCPGGQLTLTCIAYHSNILTWTVEGNISASRSVPFSGTDQLVLFSGSGVRFNLKRVSAAENLPFQSDLVIDRVNTNINGTRIQCLPLNESDSESQITFTIYVLGGWLVYGYKP